LDKVGLGLSLSGRSLNIAAKKMIGVGSGAMKPVARLQESDWAFSEAGIRTKWTATAIC
jgi:hypothetical protein